MSSVGLRILVIAGCLMLGVSAQLALGNGNGNYNSNSNSNYNYNSISNSNYNKNSNSNYNSNNQQHVNPQQFGGIFSGGQSSSGSSFSQTSSTAGSATGTAASSASSSSAFQSPSLINVQKPNIISVQRPGSTTPPPPYHKTKALERFDHRYPDGSYEFRYELDDGTARYERGYYLLFDKVKTLVVVGYYSYRMTDGRYLTVFYNADNLGYRQNQSITPQTFPNLPRSIDVPEFKEEPNLVALTSTTPYPYLDTSTSRRRN